MIILTIHGYMVLEGNTIHWYSIQKDTVGSIMRKFCADWCQARWERCLLTTCRRQCFCMTSLRGRSYEGRKTTPTLPAHAVFCLLWEHSDRGYSLVPGDFWKPTDHLGALSSALCARHARHACRPFPDWRAK